MAEFIVSLPNSGYTLRDPIPVNVDYEEDYYIVSDDRFLRYGIGPTVPDAKVAYANALLDYYDDLREFEGRLAPHLARDLQDLRTILIPKAE